MKKIVLLLLYIYKRLISPALLPILGAGCRFSPTCSEYAKVAIGRFGVARGGVLAVKRILSCNPFARGFIDPVPSNFSKVGKFQNQNIKFQTNTNYQNPKPKTF